MSGGVKKFDGKEFVLTEVVQKDGPNCEGCAGEYESDLCVAMCTGCEPHCVTSPGKVWKLAKGGALCTK